MEAAGFLLKCLEQVSDPRKARGVRHPFQAILRLTLLGLVYGQTTMSHIVRRTFGPCCQNRPVWSIVFSCNYGHPKILHR